MLDLFLAQFFIISSFRADDDCLTIFLEIFFIIIIVKTLENYFHNLLPAITRFELAFDKAHLDFGAEFLNLNSVESFVLHQRHRCLISLCEALLVLKQYMDRCLGCSVISSSVLAWPNLICCPVSLTTMMLVRGMSRSSGISKTELELSLIRPTHSFVECLRE